MLHFSPQRRDRLGFNNEDDTYTGGSALKKSFKWQTTRLRMTETRALRLIAVSPDNNPPFQELFVAGSTTTSCLWC